MVGFMAGQLLSGYLMLRGQSEFNQICQGWQKNLSNNFHKKYIDYHVFSLYITLTDLYTLPVYVDESSSYFP